MPSFCVYSGDVFKLMLRDAAVIDQLLSPAQMLPPRKSVRVNLFLRVFRVSYRVRPIRSK